MPRKDVTLIADKGYTPPDPPEPAPDLTAAQKTKVKARVTKILKEGPGVDHMVYNKSTKAWEAQPIPTGPLEMWQLVHFTCGRCRQPAAGNGDNIPTLTAAQAKAVIMEMAKEGAFAEGYSPQVPPQPEPE